ncbi:L-amino acid N-acyltransferase YncA [Mycobacterium sp. OTB74]|jgi:hypothetical protein|nr:L-amino acid N-acyltransferase YncA [Mycobacterium sp. OTB74]
MSTRPATPADLPVIAEIYAHSVRNTVLLQCTLK